ncbi:MAG: fimbria major subunit [Muribaculaceae bacterium]|nr:fimbria major subunit [Muribaculaceae bacterium]
MKKTYALALASGLLLLGSCTNDAPETPQYDPIDAEGNIGYIRFNINNSDTRANSEATDKGETYESAIDHIDFLFTDVNNQPFKVRVEKDSIRGTQATVKLPRMPKYVAAIVNGNGNYENITDLTQASHAVDHYTNPTAGENQQFYMSSSRYWDNTAAHNKVYRTNISASQVYKSWEAAKTGTPVAITVERYVAKVNVKSEIELTNGTLDPMTGDHEHDIKNGGADAKVSFEPEYVFLTGVNDKGFRIKDLPDYSWMEQNDLEEWGNDAGGKRSFWVGNTAGTVQFQTLNILNGTTANTETWAKWSKAINDTKVFYPFENNQSSYAKKTSVVVAGKYSVTDAAGKSLADTDGTFYLVAFENQFTVCKTEAEAVKAMGGATTDVLVPEGANSTDLDIATTPYSNNAWTGWTGWMKIKGSNNVIRCIKYNGGYGYYSKEIVRTYAADETPYEAIVRNHLYTINIKGISGMGVGIPDPDQPIINIPTPDPSAQNYFLNMSVTVAPWKVVPAQNTEWK